MGMTKYEIQFQNGLGLPEFLTRFGKEEQCEAHLAEIKWPNGFKCPKCGEVHHSEFRKNGRPYYQCSSCRYQCSLTANTLFHGSHLSLTRWFMALYFVSEAKTQLSSLELHRYLDVNHKTAWLVLHKIMQVMVDSEVNHKLSGRIEMDDAYLGGKQSGGKSGRGAPAKQPFVAAIQTSPEPDKHPIYVKLAPVQTFSAAEIEEWTKQNIKDGSHIVTDGLACFNGVEKTCEHEIHISNKMIEAEKEKHFKWVNTVLSNIKTGLTGTFHSFECSKYSFRYLGAIMFRFNRRFRLSTIFLKLVKHAGESPPIPASAISL